MNDILYEMPFEYITEDTPIDDQLINTFTYKYLNNNE